jgi:hypothetical protein
MTADEGLATIASAIQGYYMDGYDASDPMYVAVRDAFRKVIAAMAERNLLTYDDVFTSWQKNLSEVTDNWEPGEEDKYDLSLDKQTVLQADGSALRFPEEDVLLRYVVDDLLPRVPESEVGGLVQTFLRSI